MEVCERGDISFFFRPTVQPADLERAASLGVQSFFFVMSPASGPHRRVRVGRKRMPHAPGERFWARVERVGSMQRVLGGQLEAEHYQTKTRGDRYQPGARPLGQGQYAILRHDDHLHLRYDLEAHEFDAPEELLLPDTEDHVVLFEAPPQARAVWAADADPSRLDAEGTELVLVGHRESGNVVADSAKHDSMR